VNCFPVCAVNARLTERNGIETQTGASTDVINETAFNEAPAARTACSIQG
jgi:hypothetical protein